MNATRKICPKTLEKGMARLARELGLDRKGPYTALSQGGNPSFKTVFTLIDLLGLRIKLEPQAA